MSKKRTLKSIRLHDKRTTAKYHRYSTGRQDEDSIERQEGITEEYRIGRGMVEGPSFSDRAQSGYTGDRPEFQALILFCEANFGTDLIVESISRLVRDGFPYTEIVRLRKLHGLRVHSVMDGGLLDAEREAELVARYTRDHHTISYYTRAGILTKARKGKWVTRVPWGCYKDDQDVLRYLPDFKEHVQNLFAMKVGERLSTVQIAARMQAHKVPSPNGTISWTSSQVKMILGRRMYTGRVRVSRLKADWEISMYKNEEEASTAYYADFETFMPQLEAVSLEDFESIQSQEYSKKRNKHEFVLQSFVFCSCCGNELRTSYFADRPLFVCKTQECSDRSRYRVVMLEETLFEAFNVLSDRLLSEEAFKQGIAAECDALDAWVADRRRKLDTEIADLKMKLNQGRARLPLIDAALLSDFQADLVKWHSDMKKLEDERAILPRHLVTNMLDEAGMHGFAETLQDYTKYLPLVPDDGPRARIYRLIKNKLVKSINIVANPLGGHDVTFHIRVILHGEDLNRAVVREITMANRDISPVDASKKDVARRLIDTATASLTVVSDEEVRILSDVEGIGDLTDSVQRAALNVLLTCAATDGEVGMPTTVKLFGGVRKLAYRACFLRQRLDHEEVARRLTSHRGQPIKSMPPVDMGRRSYAAKLALRHHPILMIKLAYEGGFRAKLSDEQFSAIEPHLPAEYRRKHWRGQLDRFFYVLRTGQAIRGSGLTKETLKRMHTLNRDNRLTRIVEALLNLEGWALPPGYVVETLRCGRTADTLVDMDAQRWAIAKQLSNRGGEMPTRPKWHGFFNFDNVEVDPKAGLVRNAEGVMRSFIPIDTITAMFSTPEKFAPWPNEGKELEISRFCMFLAVLRAVGWRRGDSAIILSRNYGGMVVLSGADAGEGKVPKAYRSAVLRGKPAPWLRLNGH